MSYPVRRQKLPNHLTDFPPKLLVTHQTDLPMGLTLTSHFPALVAPPLPLVLTLQPFAYLQRYHFPVDHIQHPTFHPFCPRRHQLLGFLTLFTVPRAMNLGSKARTLKHHSLSSLQHLCLPLWAIPRSVKVQSLVALSLFKELRFEPLLGSLVSYQVLRKDHH